jgi:23S rRNA (uracil1939-C5)-methyltransferase
MKKFSEITTTLEKIVNGGQALGTTDDGKKVFAWGGLPGEIVQVKLTNVKKSYSNGIVQSVMEPSRFRITPRDKTSYMSTSPWQIMSYEYEQEIKKQLIVEAFKLHHTSLPHNVTLFSHPMQFEYRNKVEFSFYWNNETQQIDLAFFQRGSHNKVPVEGTSLITPDMNHTARAIRDILRSRKHEARDLKTLIVRAEQNGKIVFQLYTKTKNISAFTPRELQHLTNVKGWEIIYSDPQSPASIITERLHKSGDVVLQDTVLHTSFRYACEGFFQINIPVYEQALTDMKRFVNDRPVVDLYSGVGSIGLTIGGDAVTLVESNEHAVREMKNNIARLQKNATAILASIEKALEYITQESTIIVDPPRAGLHSAVIHRLLDTRPPRIMYLSCNPVTQARDIALLLEKYEIIYHQGYNFFPRTPHIEQLVILDRR